MSYYQLTEEEAVPYRKVTYLEQIFYLIWRKIRGLK